ncbi:MAG: hypothetical protein ACH349_06915 [Candidatus Rhabdochlamydia sp.]|nr:hypothetical protein [Chlamydiota bacterium]
MKNLVKLFGLSIVLSIAGLNAFENPFEKTYVDSEDITFEDGTICLDLGNGTLKPVTSVYSDEKGVYVLNQDDESHQSAEPDVLCMQDNQDELGQPIDQEILYTQDAQEALDQTIKEETLCAQNAYRELMAGYECPNCGHINPRHRKTCTDCDTTIIH